MKRGPRAHLFQIYPLLCKIVSLKHEGPTAWVKVPAAALPTPAPSPIKRSGDLKSENSSEKDIVAKLDARSLSIRCLEELGKEMGLIH